MEIQFISNTFIDLDVGYRVRLQGRELVIAQYSIEPFPPYMRYEIELAWPDNCRGVDSYSVAVDFDKDLRIMSWRTSGWSPFDLETMRGTEAAFPLLPRSEHTDLSAFMRRKIHTEVEAMDWPEVIGDE